MKKIYKYPLLGTERIKKIEFPVNAKPMSILVQGSAIVLYLEVDLREPKAMHEVVVACTGDAPAGCALGDSSSKDHYTFVGTVMLSSEVLHVYVSNKPLL